MCDPRWAFTVCGTIGILFKYIIDITDVYTRDIELEKQKQLYLISYLNYE